MGLLDKVMARVTPEPSDNDIAAARAQLRASTSGAAWLRQVCDHHDQIDAAFAAVRGARVAAEQRAAQKRLAVLLNGHALAEEAVLYPAMALSDQKSHANTAYAQQSMAKVQLAALERLKPLSADYTDKLQQLWAAVVHHVYEEETEWYPRLRDACDTEAHARLAKRYREEATAYLGAELPEGRSASAE